MGFSCLVRHATADKGKPKSPDRKRVLSKKGRKEAVKMAKKLKKNDMLPDLLVSSPAKRAIQTARVFAKAVKYPKDKILLKIRNSVQAGSNPNQLAPAAHTGLGIEAVRRLLDSSFRKKYYLDARPIGDVFAVDLIIGREAA